jgi:hypothetical protein
MEEVQLENGSVCEGKKRYTKKDAHIIASILTMKSGELMEGYKCIKCEHYHVGHVTTPRKLRKIIEGKDRIVYNTLVLEEVQNDTSGNV